MRSVVVHRYLIGLITFSVLILSLRFSHACNMLDDITGNCELPKDQHIVALDRAATKCSFRLNRTSANAWFNKIVNPVWDEYGWEIVGQWDDEATDAWQELRDIAPNAYLEACDNAKSTFLKNGLVVVEK